MDRCLAYNLWRTKRSLRSLETSNPRNLASMVLHSGRFFGGRRLVKSDVHGAAVPASSHVSVRNLAVERV